MHQHGVNLEMRSSLLSTQSRPPLAPTDTERTQYLYKKIPRVAWPSSVQVTRCLEANKWRDIEDSTRDRRLETSTTKGKKRKISKCFFPAKLKDSLLIRNFAKSFRCWLDWRGVGETQENRKKGRKKALWWKSCVYETDATRRKNPLRLVCSCCLSYVLFHLCAHATAQIDK